MVTDVGKRVKWPMNRGSRQETLARKESLRYLVSGYILQETWGESWVIPRMWMAGAQANPTVDWEPKAFKARALPSRPSCHQQMWKMQRESTTRAAGGSFPPLRSRWDTNRLCRLEEMRELLHVFLISKRGQEDWSQAHSLLDCSRPLPFWEMRPRKQKQAQSIAQMSINLLLMILWFPLHIFLMQGTGSFHHIGQNSQHNQINAAATSQRHKALFPFHFETRTHCASGAQRFQTHPT